jgi:hypothetical protein
MQNRKRTKPTINVKIDGRNYDINNPSLYYPFCKTSKQLAKLMKVEGFEGDQLSDIAKLGYNIDLFIKQNKGHTHTIDFFVKGAN